MRPLMLKAKFGLVDSKALSTDCKFSIDIPKFVPT